MLPSNINIFCIMAGRSKKTITSENVAYVYRYLLTALAHPNRGMKFITGPEKREAALMALRDLSVSVDTFLQGIDTFAPDPDKLTVWCEESLEPETMPRIWTAYRQQGYKQRHEVKRIGIKKPLYYRLAVYADHQGLTIEKALDKLLKNVSY